MTETPSTITNIGVAMFTVADQDKALDFYTRVLGFEVRGDTRFGPNEEYRWLEVAPPGSTARLALNPPMYDTPGGSSIGVETSDVRAEHARLSAFDGFEMEPLGEDDDPNVPPMFMLKDPDGNVITVVQA
ncbi:MULTISPECIES: VOC family protein [unclassified Rhodococcus (in: high G+C Gram-positive bacteria)]|jgi:catechol 2,3-dioxygenase-like lactoylglutathione lyase family enzyme|uniref:VOC family protein n=1 Tax=unclassified Rhodococcus (in: high G+C Gram-positive bacteria) TaxID=192944 RepID=UPI0027834C7F|nr:MULTISPECIES: VOC family protein [unclassified Rhodococcus (in: high G+C Gram-positive bacteria)]MDQ1200194.1 lactoylglutathione lyase [Rhodococcus sp. SORGH_AS_0303]